MHQADVIIIGAGPVGLFQVFELGLQGIRAVVIDSLPHIGGQCAELYPQKPIFDIPGIPQITASKLVENLRQQASPFHPEYILDNRVVDLTRSDSDEFYKVKTDKGLELEAKYVIIAGGAGSFEPVKLKVKGIEQFLDKQMFYKIQDLDKHKDKDVVILGGGDAAFDWALELQKVANSVVLVHRSSNYRASPSSVSKVENLCKSLEMQLITGQVIDFVKRHETLAHLLISSKDGVTRSLELQQLMVFFGLSPKLSFLKDWGLTLMHNHIQVSTETFESSMPDIYAVGDINWYPGKQKLILSGFHETALAAFSIKSKLNQGKRVPLLYTTTSPIAHKRLGVSVS